MTIAQQLKIKEFPFSIKDNKGNRIYLENSKGVWERFEYDSGCNRIYLETSYGYWWKREYNLEGREIYYENSSRYWIKREYDSNNNVIYYETLSGVITDNRPKPVTELTMDEIAAKFNIPVSQLKVIK